MVVHAKSWDEYHLISLASKSVHTFAWQVYSIPLEYLFQCNDRLSAQVSGSFLFWYSVVCFEWLVWFSNNCFLFTCNVLSWNIQWSEGILSSGVFVWDHHKHGSIRMSTTYIYFFWCWYDNFLYCHYHQHKLSMLESTVHSNLMGNLWEMNYCIVTSVVIAS
jgi:hypothetical protein